MIKKITKAVQYIQAKKNTGVDPDSWKNFSKDSEQPYGNLPCTLGYDPAVKGDQTFFTILSKENDKFRQLVRKNWNSEQVTTQAEYISDYLSRYNVKHWMDFFSKETMPIRVQAVFEQAMNKLQLKKLRTHGWRCKND